MRIYDYRLKINILDYIEQHPGTPSTVIAEVFELPKKRASNMCGVYHYGHLLSATNGFGLNGYRCKYYTMTNKGQRWVSWAKVFSAHLENLQTGGTNDLSSQLDEFRDIDMSKW